MITNTLTLLGMAALATAQSTTVSLFIPFADPQSLVASIAGSDSTATTYVVQCANSAAAASIAAGITAAEAAATQGAAAVTGNFDAAESACGFTSAFTIVEGPSTVEYSVAYFGAYAASINCALSGTSTAACTVSSSGVGAALATNAALATGAALPTRIKVNGDLITTTLTGDDAESGYMPVVITAGSATAKAVGATTTGAAGKDGSTMSTVSAKSEASTGSSTGTSTGISSSAATKGTNGAVAAAPVLGAGILGAFGVAVAGAML